MLIGILAADVIVLYRYDTWSPCLKDKQSEGAELREGKQ